MICHLDYLSVLCACKAFKVSVKQKEQSVNVLLSRCREFFMILFCYMSFRHFCLLLALDV